MELLQTSSIKNMFVKLVYLLLGGLYSSALKYSVFTLIICNQNSMQNFKQLTCEVAISYSRH